MTIDLERWIEFLHKAKLTPSQYAFLAILHEKKYKLIYMIKDISDNVLPKEELHDIIDRGYLYNWNDAGAYKLDQFELTEKCREMFAMKCSWACAEEFVAAFPKWLYIQGKQVPARNCDLDELEKLYYLKVVKRGMHPEVMEQLTWAVKNRKISMGIEKWFTSRQWEALAEMRSNSSVIDLPADRELR
jgi:hypothetical protein